MTSGRTALAAVVGLALCGFPAVAGAAKVSIQSGTMVFQAAAGERNGVVVSRSVERNQDFSFVTDRTPPQAGPGCREVELIGVHCATAGVQRLVLRLGDGDDEAKTPVEEELTFPVEMHGEEGDDDLDAAHEPGSVLDGGDGSDVLLNAETMRGGAGDDKLNGLHVLEGGAGDDTLEVVARDDDPRGEPPVADPRLLGGPGNDDLSAGDGRSQRLSCGSGRDYLSSYDPEDRLPAKSDCELGIERPTVPRIAVFELPGFRVKPRNGRLAVYLSCTEPRCVVAIRIRAAYEVGAANRDRTRFRRAPVRRLHIGRRVRLVRVPLTRAQRRGLSRIRTPGGLAGSLVVSVVGGAKSRFSMEKDVCRRESPCE